MDRRPIGVFDSGLGGLTALRELARLMPGEELVYFGDTGRVPYGGRSRETLIKYARQDAAFLERFHPKAIVVACGTVSTTALPVLRRECAVPVFGVVEPAVRAAAESSRSGRIGLIGTNATIRSGAYEEALFALRPDAQVTARACPLFVPLVENGRFRQGDAVVEMIAEEYLAPMKAAQVDALILGCTHYPLLRDVIGACMGPEVALVDAGACCARFVREWLLREELCSDRDSGGAHRFFVSDSTENFAALATIFMGENISGGVEQISITGD